jgi:hypothetical protein
MSLVTGWTAGGSFILDVTTQRPSVGAFHSVIHWVEIFFPSGLESDYSPLLTDHVKNVFSYSFVAWNLGNLLYSLSSVCHEIYISKNCTVGLLWSTHKHQSLFYYLQSRRCYLLPCRQHRSGRLECPAPLVPHRRCSPRCSDPVS